VSGNGDSLLPRLQGANARFTQLDPSTPSTEQTGAVRVSSNHPREAEQQTSSNEEDDEDVEQKFYNRKKRPQQKVCRFPISSNTQVCPFSLSTRQVPCTSHDQPRKRKDNIMNHLKKIRDQGGDAQHPLDDPLWDSWAVNWFLLPRPARFDNSKRKVGTRKSQQRYYRERTKMQTTQEASMRQLLEDGAIGPNEYKKILIGEKRRRFITETRVKAQIEGALHIESEKRMNEEIARKLEELRSDGQLETNSQSISTLVAAQDELETSRDTVNAYKHVLSTQMKSIVDFYASKGFLETDRTFLDHHGFNWPTIPSASSFYVFATVLTPMQKWDCQIRSASNIKLMQKELHEYVQAEKNNLDQIDVIGLKELDEILGIFNSCCDIVKEEEQRTQAMTLDGSQTWYDEQNQLWEDAKSSFLARFQLNVQSPIQLFRLMDQFADIWRAHSSAEEANTTAQAAVTCLL